MIYIIGHKFTANSASKNESKTVSITEKLALARRNMGTPKISSVFDPRFLAGNVYEISRIYKVIENDEPKIKYIFKNVSKQENDIDMTFLSIGEGENYIAALSGSVQELNNIRNSITSAYETSTDV